jgi:hypothetical protein
MIAIGISVPNVKQVATRGGDAMLFAYRRITNAKAAIIAGLKARLIADAALDELIATQTA